jgi:hypothetical protein
MPFASGEVEMNEEYQSDKHTPHKDIQGIFEVPPVLSRGMRTGASISSEQTKELNEKTNEEEESDKNLRHKF